MNKIVLTDLTASEMAEAFGIKPFQGKQLYKWIYAKRVLDFDAMTDLSKALRTTLAEQCFFPQLELLEGNESAVSGTLKNLYRLHDGETIESVLLRANERITLCLSTQVGCALGCAFCATGESGFKRNLSPGEIVEQALFLLKDEELGERTPNIVYMGMGEPFQNYEATMKSIRLLMAPEGLGVGARKITISTAGDIPGIQRFAKEDIQVRLSVSLHAANDALRSQLVPLNKRYPLRDLIAAVHDYTHATQRQVTFEWVLMNEVNDTIEAARELAGLIKNINASVNLIPYNPAADLGFSTPSDARCLKFREMLEQLGIKAVLRRERGRDIDAACGQLRRKHL